MDGDALGNEAAAGTQVPMSVLVARLAAALQARGWMMATAESCTGGLIAAHCTDRPGSSLWFERGFVTYSNEAKTEMLGVPAELIAAHGAVSEPVAQAMALGALQHSRAHLAVSVTGIAGPGGAVPGKPVGTVWMGWAVRGERPDSAARGLAHRADPICAAVRFQFEGDRAAVRQATVMRALERMLQMAGDAA